MELYEYFEWLITSEIDAQIMAGNMPENFKYLGGELKDGYAIRDEETGEEIEIHIVLRSGQKGI